MFSSNNTGNIKKITATLLAVLLILALAGALLVNVAKANPWIDSGWVAPESTTTPPRVSILNLQNGTKYASPPIKITYTVTPIHGPDIVLSNLIEVYYSASWLQDEVYVFQDLPHGLVWEEFSGTFELKEIPQGPFSLTVTAVYYGEYVLNTKPYTGARFMINGSSTANFAVDLKPLRIGILAPYPQAYSTSDVALTLTTNEKTSQLQYSLDAQDNITINGNATLSGLTAGSHNVTVYGWDQFGNPGNSETTTFTITEPEQLPTSQLIAASAVASATAICLALIVYFTKRKKKKTTQ
jgi:hypothetical protein